MDRLSALNAFMRTAETRSFTAASGLLGISASAVGKSVARLEDRLGVRLFHRTTRNMALTSEGAMFLARCRQIFDQLDAAQNELSQGNDTRSGPLRISLPVAATALITPAISGFMHSFPRIRIDLDYSDRIVDIVEEGFDAVIRTGAVGSSGLMNRSLTTFRHRLIASPDYLRQRGTPRHVEDLRTHSCLHHRHPATGKAEPWPLNSGSTATASDIPISALVSSAEARIFLAVQGHGIACVPGFAVERQIAAGALVPILDDAVDGVGTLRIIWPASRHLSSRVRTLIDFLTHHFAAA